MPIIVAVCATIATMSLAALIFGGIYVSDLRDEIHQLQDAVVAAGQNSGSQDNDPSVGNNDGTSNQGQPSDQTSTAPVNDQGSDQSAGDAVQLTEAEAVAIALAHAGLTQGQVTGLHANLDREHGRAEYEIEFYQNRTEYEYDIDAATGEIRSHSADQD